MTKIKISDLSIGDWVATPSAEGYIIDLYTSEKAGCIARLVHDDVQMVSEWECIHLEPIPLTPEILEKNGFEEGKRYDGLDVRVFSNGNISVSIPQYAKWNRVRVYDDEGLYELSSAIIVDVRRELGERVSVSIVFQRPQI